MEGRLREEGEMRGGGEDKKEIVYEEGSSNKDWGERVVKPFFN